MVILFCWILIILIILTFCFLCFWLFGKFSIHTLNSKLTPPSLFAGLVNPYKSLYVLLLLCYRQECKKLREELREEHEEDKASALAQLAQNKEQELSNARESWQRKVEDLLEQVRLLLSACVSIRFLPGLCSLCYNYARRGIKWHLMKCFWGFNALYRILQGTQDVMYKEWWSAALDEEDFKCSLCWLKIVWSLWTQNTRSLQLLVDGCNYISIKKRINREGERMRSAPSCKTSCRSHTRYLMLNTPQHAAVANDHHNVAWLSSFLWSNLAHGWTMPTALFMSMCINSHRVINASSSRLAIVYLLLILESDERSIPW